MKPAVYLGRSGLLSTLGLGLSAHLAALQRAPVPAPLCDLGAEQRWPLHRLPAMAGDWQQRLAQAVRAVVVECGVQPHAGLPLFIGSSSLDIGYEEEQQARGGPSFAGHLHSLADSVTRALDWPGPVLCFSTACTSALQALLAARDWLQAGRGEEALVLGIEMDNRFTAAGFAGLQLLSPTGAKPFAVTRDGLVLGHAVAALRLQAAPTPWRLAGAAHRVDGGQPTGLVPATLQATVRDALAQAECGLGQVQLIKAQAAGSPPNDAAEAQALHAMFGAAAIPPLLGFKPWVGHCMGASAAVELALLMACVDEGVWPAALLADAPADPAFGVRWAQAGERLPARSHLLFHSVGFGGGHGALLLQREAAC